MARTSDRLSAGDRFGQFLAAGITALLWVLVNIAPGWQSWAFVTADADEVLGLLQLSLLGWLNLSLVVSAGASLLNGLTGSAEARRILDLPVSVIGLIVMVTAWNVFPFTFPEGSPWWTIVRVAVGVGVVGSAIGIVAAIVRLLRPRTVVVAPSVPR